jgi:hypothetical protein
MGRLQQVRRRSGLVRDQHHRSALVPGRGGEQLHHLLAGQRVQRTGRLVGEQHLGPGRPGRGPARPAAPACRTSPQTGSAQDRPGRAAGEPRAIHLLDQGLPAPPVQTSGPKRAVPGKVLSQAGRFGTDIRWQQAGQLIGGGERPSRRSGTPRTSHLPSPPGHSRPPTGRSSATWSAPPWSKSRAAPARPQPGHRRCPDPRSRGVGAVPYYFKKSPWTGDANGC